MIYHLLRKITSTRKKIGNKEYIKQNQIRKLLLYRDSSNNKMMNLQDNYKEHNKN